MRAWRQTRSGAYSLAVVVVLAAAGCATTEQDPGISTWPQWRGLNRDSISADVPKTLPGELRILWKQPLTGPALSGVAATDRHVVVADKDRDGKQDVFRCLDADTGKELWALSYAASGNMDCTNSPRATPVIYEGLVYLLGAFGDLHCLRLADGKVVWKRNILREFRARLPHWGLCASPLIVDGKLIVSPGAKDASLVALSPQTGKLVWKTPSRAPAYASLIVARFGGVKQVVGYDETSLGGWDPVTGRRLWELVPEIDGDFNVPTPIAVDGRLLVATENNGTRLYGFDAAGQIQPKPRAQNEDLVPDTVSPVVLDGLVFGCSGALYCLDLADGLKMRWEGFTGRAYDEYASLIAGNGHVLVTTVEGELLLVEATRTAYKVVSRLRLFKDEQVWSHPALVDKRLYVRSDAAIYCILLAGS